MLVSARVDGIGPSSSSADFFRLNSGILHQGSTVEIVDLLWVMEFRVRRLEFTAVLSPGELCKLHH